MNFNLDDPLEDLLSDNASEDSFSNFLAKKAPDKSKVDNLFGIANKSEPQQSTIPATTTTKPPALRSPSPIIKKTAPSSNIEPPKPFTSAEPSNKTPPAKKEIKFDDNDDIFADLGFDPKKPKAAGKSSSILDDILGVSEINKLPSRNVSAPRSNAATTSSSQSVPSHRPTSEIYEKSSNDILKPATGYTPSTSRPRTAASSKRNSFTDNKLSDPLGFFSSNQTQPKEETTQPENHSTQKNSSSLDWLGLGSTSNDKTSNELPLQANAIQPNSATIPSPLLPPSSSAVLPLSNIFKPNIQQTAHLFANVNSDSGASMQHLQQQETQLQVANQMRQQEIALVDLQRRQHEMLQHQEHHFNALLQKQLQRQGALDDSIRQQQERINSHLNMLMMVPQPTAAASFDTAKDPGLDDLLTTSKNAASGETFVELKVENKRLQMENLRLSDMVEHAKENHEKELDLLESSHRKQMLCVEESLTKLEARLRQENTSLEEFYGRKLDDLIGDRVQLLKEHDEKQKRLIEEHSVVLDQLKASHSEEIGRIRGDHIEMIKHLRNSKNLEFSLVQENSNYLDTLKSASGYLETASEDLQNIRVDFEERIEKVNREREIQLAAREKRCEEQQRHFEKLRDSTEAERTSLLDLVRTLELKLNSVNQSSEEEQWVLRQQLATLGAERMAFERERTFVRDRIDREEKRLEELKATQANEFKRMNTQIEDDRLLIVAEKIKLETMARLQRPADSNVSRLEIDAAVQVAQDAARQHDLERGRLIEMQRTYETRKRELIDQENALRNKQNDLDSAMNSLVIKERKAESKFSGCKVLEQNLQLKLRMIHQNGQELADREAKLSQERYDLSRDRLELQSMRRKIFESRCSLCKIGERSQQLGNMLAKSGMDVQQKMGDVPNMDVVDPIGDHGRFGADNLNSVLDLELGAELEKLKQYGVDGMDDDNDLLLDPELMMHRLDVMKGFEDF